MPAALDGTERDCIDHQPRLEARLDLKETAYLAQHCHSLKLQRRNGRFEPEKS
jgi:hypothetical protein